MANEVIYGKYGNGAERKDKIEALGYNYEDVQNKVNELINTGSSRSISSGNTSSVGETTNLGTTSSMESTLSSEVATNSVGNAGKSLEELANEVIYGKYGNGAERKTKIESLGYNYEEVQNKVNELINSRY